MSCLLIFERQNVIRCLGRWASPLVVCACIAPVLGQKADSVTFRLSLSLPVAAQFAACDQLGNTYVITNENAIEKYAPDGRRLARYTQNRMGRATRLDVSNPLKIMVLYSDFRTAVFLDRSLTELGMLDWDAAGYPFVRCIALASDGNLWLYDEADFRLRKITPTGEPLFESQALNLLHDGPMPKPACMLEGDNQVFLSDSAQGIFVFDAYAQFSKLLFFKGVGDFSVVEGRLFFIKGGFLHTEQIGAFRSEQTLLPEVALADWTRCFFNHSRLICVLNEQIEILSNQ